MNVELLKLKKSILSSFVELPNIIQLLFRINKKCSINMIITFEFIIFSFMNRNLEILQSKLTSILEHKKGTKIKIYIPIQKIIPCILRNL